MSKKMGMSDLELALSRQPSKNTGDADARAKRQLADWGLEPTSTLIARYNELSKVTKRVSEKMIRQTEDRLSLLGNSPGRANVFFFVLFWCLKNPPVVSI